MIKIADMVFETTQTQGVNDISLLGAEGGFRSFNEALSDGDQVPYNINDSDNFEIGLGTYNSGANTLSRDQVYSSSNNGQVVDWGQGTRNVRIVLPAELINIGNDIDFSDVNITGGSITGINDLSIADGGTGASSALVAFNNLKQNATENYAGVVQKASNAEFMAGQNDEKYVTSAQVSLMGGVPVGSVMMYAAETPPLGWLVRDGSAISRDEYANLFAVIGTLYGEGDGSTTFNLPDDQGLFERGWDAGGARDPNRDFGSYQADEFKSHTHDIPLGITSAAGPRYDMVVRSDDRRSGYDSQTTTSAGGAETRPKNRAYLPIIKY